VSNAINLKALIDLSSLNHPNLIQTLIDTRSLLESININGARSIELADQNDIIFCKATTLDMAQQVAQSNSRCVICKEDLVNALPAEALDNKVFILTDRPRFLLATLLEPFNQILNQRVFGSEYIDTSARIDKSVKLSPGVVIGPNVTILNDCIIGPNTVIQNAIIGPHTFIGSNCSIGGEGFGFEIDDDTLEILKIPHFGLVRIGSNVEIFSNVCIARGSLGDTIIEDGVKIDNLVHVAHNCRIGKNSFIIANSMIGGSVQIGNSTWIAPSTSLINNLKVGARAMTGLGAVATKDINENEVVIGVPAKRLRDRY
jgi:UDP-3-O-[3-hydroxymyristoyl] glucosamine N-acyltransferase